MLSSLLLAFVFGDLSPRQSRNLHEVLDAAEDSIRDDSIATDVGSNESPASLRGSSN